MTPDQYQALLVNMTLLQTGVAVLQTRMDIVILWLTALSGVLGSIGVGVVMKELMGRNGRDKP